MPCSQVRLFWGRSMVAVAWLFCVLLACRACAVDLALTTVVAESMDGTPLLKRHRRNVPSDVVAVSAPEAQYVHDLFIWHRAAEHDAQLPRKLQPAWQWLDRVCASWDMAGLIVLLERWSALCVARHVDLWLPLELVRGMPLFDATRFGSGDPRDVRVIEMLTEHRVCGWRYWERFFSTLEAALLPERDVLFIFDAACAHIPLTDPALSMRLAKVSLRHHSDALLRRLCAMGIQLERRSLPMSMILIARNALAVQLLLELGIPADYVDPRAIPLFRHTALFNAPSAVTLVTLCAFVTFTCSCVFECAGRCGCLACAWRKRGARSGCGAAAAPGRAAMAAAARSGPAREASGVAVAVQGALARLRRT